MRGAVRLRLEPPTSIGATVILVSHIAAKAEGGEFVVADTLRGFVQRQGVPLRQPRVFVAKGFEEPVRVHEVRWRE